uniref:LuxR C-terminal-related transcriptional regulator n=1 Tax=Bifidobacterium vansinderenii TaxID=1984871 RepID=UPI001E30C819|nr:LuxR C-terminal-related transcriptional regulator [Bifidobacterium vansinderenii]
MLRLYARGSSTDEIAALLNVDRGSVFTYVNRACRKLHAADRKEALAICARYDLF